MPDRLDQPMPAHPADTSGTDFVSDRLLGHVTAACLAAAALYFTAIGVTYADHYDTARILLGASLALAWGATIAFAVGAVLALRQPDDDPGAALPADSGPDPYLDGVVEWWTDGPDDLYPNRDARPHRGEPDCT